MRSDAGRTVEAVSVQEMLATLRERGVALWTEGGRLLFRAPEGALTAELRAGLAARKGEILAFLTAPAADAAEANDPDDGRDRPLSFAQQRLWVLSRLLPDSPAYNIPVPFRLTGRIDPALLARTLGAIVRRHAVLRTTFHAPDGRPVQRVHPPSPVLLPRVDLAGLPAARRPGEAQRRAREVTERPFDLSTGPLLRAVLFHHASEEHELLLVQHHIVTDGWSVGVLAREIAALAAGEALPALPLQYADFAAWQRERLHGEAVAPLLAWWRGQLDGATPLELPPDRPRPAVQGHRGAIRELALDAGVAAALGTLGRERGATLFMTLLAAFQALAGRQAGQEDVTVGSPVAGRDRADLEGLIGFFINNLVLRVDVGGGCSFSELLARTRSAALGAYAHQELPFERLVEELAPERDLARNPLFQVAFALQPPWRTTAALPGGRLELLPFDLTTTRLDLELHLWAEPEGLRGQAVYATDLYDAATVERFLAHYGRLLQAVAAQPEAPWEELPLLTDAERHALVGGEAEAFPTACLHELFAAQVARDPGAPAVTCDGETLTYAALHRRASRCAHRLRALGIGPEARVGLLCERSIELVVGLLGILQAGAAYVPLDPGAPPERLADLAADAGLAALVLGPGLEEHLPAADLPRVRLAAGEDSAEDPADPGALDSGAVPASLAYVIYTSGSTGRPKGVGVAHAQVARLLAATQGWLGASAADVWTLFHAASFDFSVWEIWGALAHGGRLVVVPYWVSRSPAAFHELLRAEGVTILNQTPAAFRQLVQAELAGGLPPVASLRCVIFGGEALDRRALQPWFDRHGDRRPRLVNMYGITETTVHVTWCPLAADAPPPAAGSAIGAPLPDLQAYVLDRGLRLLPAGVPGELHVGGAGLARGYLGQPEKTAERFVPHPFASAPGARLYRTGDLARRGAGGGFDYLGRVDQQIKVRGYRIEPGEIEACLAGHPGVLEAVVLARESAAGERRLAGWFVPHPVRAATAARQLHLERAGRLEGHALYELPNGLPVVHLNRGETDFVYREIFADAAYQRHGVVLPDGARVIDVGANIGLFSLWVAARCRGARLWAFEPMPPVFAALELNAALHGLDARLFDCALGEAEGEAVFTYYPHDTVVSGRYADAAAEGAAMRAYLRNRGAGEDGGFDALLQETQTFTRPLRTLSAVLRAEGIEAVDLLKIDVEKGEMDVLAGLAEEDWPRIRQVVVEVHDLDGRPERVRALLAGHGFRVEMWEDPLLAGAGLFNVYAVRPGAVPAAATVPDQDTAADTLAPLAGWGPQTLAAALRRHLQDRLPDYMVPATLVALEALPLTGNGKLNRRALPDPEALRRRAEDAFVAPRTAAERTLAAIWAEVLGVERVGARDGFFALGGDSILSMLIVSRALQAGLRLTPRQVFQHPVLADLAAVAGVVAGAAPAPAPAAIADGAVPPTPILRWFFARELPDAHHFNQAFLFSLQEPVDAGRLAGRFQKALARLIDRHDALRLRHDGGVLTVAPPGGAAPCTRVDLAALPQPARRGALEAACAAAQASLDLTRGPLVRALLVTPGPDGAARLLLAAHHLGVDGVSWRLLLDELEALYRRPEADLPPPTTPFAGWAAHLAALAGTPELAAELPFWEAAAPPAVAQETVDAGREGDACTLRVALDPETTRALLSEVPAAYGSEINDALLAALAAAFAGERGAASLWLDLEGHGREEELAPGMDLTRTVGWFTSLFPVRLEAVAGDPGAALQAARERLRQVPRRGLGFGLLRWLGGAEAERRLAALPRPEVCFNYLGQFDQAFTGGALLRLAPEDPGPLHAPRGRRSHRLEVICQVLGGRLVADWIFVPARDRHEEVAALAAGFLTALERLVGHCRARLERVRGEIGAGPVEAVFPLTPSQQGMLFESLAEPRAGRHVEQLVVPLTGPLDAAVWRRAWRRVVERHAALRTGFAWRGEEEPLQVVLRQAEMPFEERDWRGVDAAGQERLLEAWLAEDRRRGFSLAEPPLARVALLRTGEAAHLLAWTLHHAVADGWCLPLLLREVLTAVAAFGAGSEPVLPPVRPYRDYVDWLERQDPAAAAAFWRRTLAGLAGSTPLGAPADPAGPAPAGDAEPRSAIARAVLPAASTAALAALARRRQVTLDTLAEAAWALLLHRASGAAEVVFGLTAAGRPADLPGAASMVGLFINTLPLRLPVPPEKPLEEWLDTIQARRIEALAFQHCAAGQIAAWSGRPGGEPLYESVLVFQSYPMEGLGADLRRARFVGAHTRHALTLAVLPGEDLDLRLVHDRRRVDDGAAAAFLRLLVRLLERLAADPGLPLAALAAAVRADEIPRVRGRLDDPAAEEGAQGEPPRGLVEEVVAGIFAGLLGRERVGRAASFFALGGHSLQATQAAARLREAFGVEVPLADLFAAPTASGLAQRIAARRAAPLPVPPPLAPAPGAGPWPLSFAQQRLWFLDQLTTGNPFYNMPAVLRLAGRLDPAALEAALAELVRRHTALRTTFRPAAGAPVQVIGAPWRPELPRLDLSALPRAAQEAALRGVIRDLVARTVDLGRGPLLRTVLARLDGGEHRLVLTLHHIVSDGWSMGVFLRELAALTAACAAGRPSPLAEPALRYVDFAVWQRAWLTPAALAAHLEPLRRRLAGREELRLPVDRPRPAAPAFRGAACIRPLAPGLAAGVEALARQSGVTPFMVLLAAFQTLLVRLTGQTGPVVGSPIANRNHPGLEELIGFFVNSLALATDLAGDPAFAVALGRVREVTLEAFTHQDLPFERLVEELAPERKLGQNPLFQVVFALQNAPLAPVERGGLRLEMLDVDPGTSRFSWELHLWPRGGTLTAVLVYDTEQLDAATVQRALGHFETLATAAAGEPGRRLSELPLLTAAEHRQLVAEWNDTAAEVPRDRSLAELFAEEVERAPDAVALAWDGGGMTFAALHRRAGRLAGRLRALGVGPEVRVGVFLERSPELIVALLGILQAGGAYVPLDLGFPAARLQFLLEDARPPVVVTAAGLRSRLPATAARVVDVAEDGPPLGAWRGGGHLAYVDYTSGSTGVPKGVCVEHRAVVRLVRHAGFLQAGPADVFLQYAPVSFDASTLEIWAPLLNGGRLVLCPPERLTPRDLGALVARHGVTVLWLTAGLFHQAVDQLGADGLGAFAGVRHLLAGGEALSPDHVARARAALPATRLLNGYGPTENTTFTCVHPVAEVAGAVPIGRPIGNTQVHVLDADLRLLPVGVPGELCTGGDGLARGYLERPERTAESFVPDPFAAAPGGRLYRTGDRVRRRSDGRIEFLGRLDHQVKVRGFRVEPGEIEEALAAHPAVREAVVVLREDAPGDRRLVAYVTADPDHLPGDAAPEARAEQVEEWRMLFDDLLYGETATEDGDPTFNIAGWKDSATGASLGAPALREWLDDRVERLLSFAPRRVLEIGCGTGLLTFRLAAACEAYVGTDISRVSLDYVRRHLGVLGEAAARVRLLERRADDLAGFAPGGFDAVVLNSVVQYFPGIDYLLQVIEGAVELLAPGGFLFLGDLRSLPLLEAFHADVERRRDPEVDREELDRRVRDAVARENELVLDPALFPALARRLPRLAGSEIHLQRGRHHNELTRYRYDAILHLDRWPGASSDPVAWSDASGLSLEEVGARLRAAERPFGLLRVPNGRLGAGLDPAALHALAAARGWGLDAGWSDAGPEGRYDAIFSPQPAAAHLPLVAAPGPPRPWAAYANRPLRAKLTARLEPLLRAHLGERLPAPMVPSHLVALERLPLTAGGKVDRAALPAPGAPAAAAGAYVAPRDPVEARLAALWQEVLRLDRVGVHSDFFALGGHSLLATQLVSRVRDAFQVELPLRHLFENPTVAGLRGALDALLAQGATAAPAPAIVALSREGRRRARPVEGAP